MSESRVRVSLSDGLFEFEGSESFVSAQVEKFAALIQAAVAVEWPAAPGIAAADAATVERIRTPSTHHRCVCIMGSNAAGRSEALESDQLQGNRVGRHAINHRKPAGRECFIASNAWRKASRTTFRAAGTAGPIAVSCATSTTPCR